MQLTNCWENKTQPRLLDTQRSMLSFSFPLLRFYSAAGKGTEELTNLLFVLQGHRFNPAWLKLCCPIKLCHHAPSPVCGVPKTKREGQSLSWHTHKLSQAVGTSDAFISISVKPSRHHSRVSWTEWDHGFGEKNPKPQTQYKMATGTQISTWWQRGEKGAKPHDKVPKGIWSPWVYMSKCMWASLPSGRTEDIPGSLGYFQRHKTPSYQMVTSLSWKQSWEVRKCLSSISSLPSLQLPPSNGMQLAGLSVVLFSWQWAGFPKVISFSQPFPPGSKPPSSICRQMW